MSTKSKPKPRTWLSRVRPRTWKCDLRILEAQDTFSMTPSMPASLVNFIFCTVEKLFTIARPSNNQNDRVYASDIFVNSKYKKDVLSQRWPRNAPYRPTWVPWKFSGIPDYAHGYYSQHFHGLLFGSTLWMFLQNLMSVALPVPEIIGGTQKFGHSPDTPTLPFLGNFQ